MAENQEREDMVNRPVVPDMETNKPKTIKPMFNTNESEYWMKRQELAKAFAEGADAGFKNAERKEREIRYNLARLEETKVKQFKKFIDTAKTEHMKKPDIISNIFHDNQIYTPSQGFTLTEMAFAWLEYFGLRDSVTLEKMRDRIKAWINKANEIHDARIYGTRVKNGISRYHIAKRTKDVNNQVDVLDGFKENIATSEDKRKLLAELLRQEQEQKKEIVIDTEGQPLQAEEKKEEDIKQEDEVEGGERE